MTKFMTSHQDQIEFRLRRIADAEQLYPLIEKNRAYLSKWLPWVKSMRSVGDEAQFLQHAIIEMDAGILWMATIVVNGEVAGMIDIHEINVQRHSGQIGYWIDKGFSGREIMSESLQQVINIAKKKFKIHRLELITDVQNGASQRVAEKNGFKREGIMRDYLPPIRDENYHDAVLFSKIL